jgi:hypothetical protein
VNFAANILWIVIGVGLLGVARSYRNSGNAVTAAIIAVIGAVALLAGLIL